MTALTELLPPSLGGRYRLQRLLATGGMSAVWLARDERLDRPVAVKVISDVLALDEEYVRRFHREARVAAGLWHPNLVSVYDSGDDPRAYLVMEYVDGPSLERILRGSRGLSGDPTRLARELLSALRCVHQHGIVHRDVKPGNVLIGADGRARLTDFGIAQPSNAPRLTNVGETIGTLAYMAPEVGRGEPATVRSDLYAAGAVIGECCAGQDDGSLTALSRSLMNPDPERRPASAADALALLELDVPARPRAGAGSAVTTGRIRSPRGGVRAARWIAVTLGVLALACSAFLAAPEGTGKTDEAHYRLPPRSASLVHQLDALDRAVEQNRGTPGQR